MNEVSAAALKSDLTHCREVHAARWEAHDAKQEEICAKLDVIDTSLRGNGRPGLQSRVSSLEEWRYDMRRLVWSVRGTMAAIILNALFQVLSACR